ncbi:Serine/threonine-protein kinase plk1 [Entomophthora muscae]|uniref:Serine/threonine-protein kinase plk1 n=1 Tax=Entomophthora muscae TaxID=34485 RepID=A0ACC2T1D4_9FUNG|nr:Serine/threonine-protein kinase plk1 [Entomophthora muscae]
MRNEVSIHHKINHPNVVKYYSTIEDADFIFIFMEICRQGSLKNLLFHRKILTEPKVCFYMLQLLSAVEYFMERKVIHCDLKLANIFVAEDMTLQIGDFGLVCKLEAGQDRWTTCCEERPDFQQVRSNPFFQGFTPCSLSKDTFCYPPQFAGDHSLILKQGLDVNGFANPSLIPGLSSPHKRGRFGAAYNPNSPVPQPKTYFFKELEYVAPTPLAQETDVKCIPTPQAVFPGPLSTECAAEESMAEQEKTKAVQPQQEDKPMAAVPNSEADLTIPSFISKCIFYGENYGQAYEFIDGTIGVNFSDLSSLILASDKEHFEFVEIWDKQCLVTHYTRAEFQKFNSHKLAFFDCFVKELISTTPAINDNAKSNLLPASLQMSAAIPDTTSRDPTLPCLFKVKQTKYGNFLCLSNSIIQIK